jgi:hypothetical protein
MFFCFAAIVLSGGEDELEAVARRHADHSDHGSQYASGETSPFVIKMV